MKCGEAQFALGADPSSMDSTLRTHLESCERCAAYALDMQELDRRLRDAMAVPVPEFELPSGPYAVEVDGAASASTTISRKTSAPTGRPRPDLARRLALAASVAGVAVLAGLLWIGVPRESLATAVVAHMAEEPNAWRSATSLPGAAVSQVLSRAGVRLKPGLQDVTYAHRCLFRGHQVPHLVVQTPGGPVTIMVLPDERVAGPSEFQEGGYRGVLVPSARGSIAVLARNATDVRDAARRALAAIEYVD